MTAAQSTTDLANGAALAISETRVAGGGAEYFYSNVKGKPYTSFEAFYAGAPDVADDLNLSAAANEIDLRGANLTLTRGAGTETLQAGTNVFSLGYHATETIDASAAGAETFRFTAGFGHETIKGLTLSGATADTVQLATSSFSYLSAGMTQAQDLAAVLAHASDQPIGNDHHGLPQRQPHTPRPDRLVNHSRKLAFSLRLSRKRPSRGRAPTRPPAVS